MLLLLLQYINGLKFVIRDIVTIRVSRTDNCYCIFVQLFLIFFFNFIFVGIWLLLKLRFLSTDIGNCFKRASSRSVRSCGFFNPFTATPRMLSCAFSSTAFKSLTLALSKFCLRCIFSRVNLQVL